MHKITNVSVLSNIIRLGITNPMRAYSTLRRWRRLQNLTKAALKARNTDAIAWVADPGLPSDPADRLFMSFHYGPWYMVLAALAQATGCRRVYCLVGQVDPSYSDRMAAMAAAAGIEIVLVPGGIAMLRGVRQARAEGALIFVLVDVPWGLGGEPDLRFPFAGGTIEARSALFAFAERAGLKPHLVVADHDDRAHRTTIRNHPLENQAQCFALLDQYVRAKPWAWDRLIDMHKYVSAPVDSLHLPFRVAQDFFVVRLADLKVVRVNRSLYELLVQAREFAASGHRVAAESIFEKLHVATNLDIRSVF